MKNAESFNQEYMSNQEFGFGVLSLWKGKT